MRRVQGKARKEEEAQQEQEQQAMPERAPREQVKELEQKRAAVAKELRAVEEQVH